MFVNRLSECITIGTAGAPSNNRMTLVDEMRLISLAHKGSLLDPTIMPAEQIFAMLTCADARALVLENQLGSLEVGKKADLIVINPNTAAMLT